MYYVPYFDTCSVQGGQLFFEKTMTMSWLPCTSSPTIRGQGLRLRAWKPSMSIWQDVERKENWGSSLTLFRFVPRHWRMASAGKGLEICWSPPQCMKFCNVFTIFTVSIELTSTSHTIKSWRSKASCSSQPSSRRPCLLLCFEIRSNNNWGVVGWVGWKWPGVDVPTCEEKERPVQTWGGDEREN